LSEALGEDIGVDALIRIGKEAIARRALNEHHIRRLRARISKRMLQLPFLYHTDLSLDDLRALGEMIIEEADAR